LADNLGLAAACATGPVVPLFIWAPDEEIPWAAGGASRWWLHHSLVALQASLEARGSRLVVRAGATRDILRDVAQAVGAFTIFCERIYDPPILTRDAALRADLGRDGVVLKGFDGALLTTPERVRSGQGRPFRVFTPFWRVARAAIQDDAPRPAPDRLAATGSWPDSTTVPALKLLPAHDWASGLRDAWQPGEDGAARALNDFSRDAVTFYGEERDYPGRAGTSRLSPHLHFGELSIRAVWRSFVDRARHRPTSEVEKVEIYLRQLGWREFAYHVLYHYPHTPTEALDEGMRSFPWVVDEEGFRRWRRGLTGFPIVDAGMRELWQTGWMHNRVRMIVASFLVKDLLCDWRRGAAWFWDTLVDADVANNTLGWQWAAGCGADAAPYFRIFNPVLQGTKFDPDGDYVRRWVPELAHMEPKWLHAPWTAPREVLARAGVELGKDYPEPVVDHASARRRALDALDSARRDGKQP
jgi:deoxyribodipyrimidine photo-lyase